MMRYLLPLLSVSVLSLGLSAQPFNDNFFDAAFIEYDGSPITEFGDNFGATTEFDEPGVDFDDPTVWWVVSVTATGPLTIDTFGSDFDTVINVYFDNSGLLEELSFIDSNDQAGGTNQSSLTIDAFDGDFIAIQVTGFDQEQGNIVLNLSGGGVPGEDFYGDRRFLKYFGDPVTGSGNTGLASTEPDEPNVSPDDASVWWGLDVFATGPIKISTEGSDFDTVLVVYDDAEGSILSLVELGFNDDADETTLTSEVEVFANDGDFLVIQVYGSSGETGNVVLTVGEEVVIPPPANDNVADAIEIPTLPATVTGTNVGATTETGEFNIGDSGTAWWFYETTAEGLLFLQLTSSFPGGTVVAYRQDGPGPSGLNYLFNEVGQGLTLRVEAGQRYYIALTGFGNFGDPTGEATFDLSFTPTTFPAPPANDDFANREVIPTFPATISGNNDGATRDAGEPSFPRDAPINASVWYEVTTPADGRFRFDLSNVTNNAEPDLLALLWRPLAGTWERMDIEFSSGFSGPASLAVSAPAGSTIALRYDGGNDYITGDFTLDVAFEELDPNILGLTLTPDTAAETAEASWNALRGYRYRVSQGFSLGNLTSPLDRTVDSDGPDSLLFSGLVQDRLFVLVEQLFTLAEEVSPD